MARLRDPLFHVVVALGAAAAAGACGETNRSPTTPSSAGGENAGAAPSGGGGSGGGGGEGAQIIVAGVAGDVAHVPAAGAPSDPCAGGAATVAVSIDGDAGGQGGALSDCPLPQLRCASYSPTPTDCVCNRGAPLSACDCRGGRYWDCFNFDPPTGCECSLATGPK